MKKIEIEKGEPLCKLGSISFREKETYLLWGESKAGKSWLSLWIVKGLTGAGLKGIFIDTEGKIHNLVHSWEANGVLTDQHLENLDLYWETDSLGGVSEMIDDSIDFIIIDTITGPYDTLNPKKRSMLVGRDLREIKEAIMEHEVLCILTTGIWENWKNSHEYKIRGGRHLKTKTNHRLFIKKVKSDGTTMDRKRIITYDEKQQVPIKVDKSFSELEVIDGEFEVLKGEDDNGS